MGRIFFTFIICLLVLSACRKPESDSGECSFLAPQIVFVNFVETDIDTLIFRRYTNTNNFSELIDTTIFSKAKITRMPVGRDSVSLTVPYPLFFENFSKYNWDIVVPNTGSITRFANIDPVFGNDRNSVGECHTYIRNVLVNTRQYTFSTWVDNNYRIYIRKP